MHSRSRFTAAPDGMWLASLVDLRGWDASPMLTERERAAISALRAGGRLRWKAVRELKRITLPLRLAFDAFWPGRNPHAAVGFMRAAALASERVGLAYWAWDEQTWRAEFRALETVGNKRLGGFFAAAAACLIAPRGADVASDGGTQARILAEVAQGVFGNAFAALVAEVEDGIARLGYSGRGTRAKERLRALARLATAAKTCDIGDEHAPILDRMFQGMPSERIASASVFRALHALGRLSTATPSGFGDGTPRPPLATSPWDPAIERWRERQTRYDDPSKVLAEFRGIACWFARNLGVESPAHLDMAACQRFAAAVMQARVGDFSIADDAPKSARGYRPSHKLRKLGLLKALLVDLARFGELPSTAYALVDALAPPKPLLRQIGTDPRPIRRDAFAKFLEAALSLTPEDVGRTRHPSRYPAEMVIALAFTVALSGLRADEVRRLDVDLFQNRDGLGDADDGAAWIIVPANKYKAEFPKPIPREVADRIEAWLRVRPDMQGATRDRKTKRDTRYLFAYRDRQIGASYVNRTVIPLICRKAGIDGYRDRHGGITNHRLRSTLATLLARGEHGMSLLQLMLWLGHKNVASTLHYVTVYDDDLAAAYRRARAHNFTVDVIVDEDAVNGVPPAPGAPARSWINTVVDGGLCRNERFAACAHRLDCVKCEHHLPADDPYAKRLLAGERARRFQQQIALEPEEIVALRRRRKKRAKPVARDIGKEA